MGQASRLPLIAGGTPAPPKNDRDGRRLRSDIVKLFVEQDTSGPLKKSRRRKDGGARSLDYPFGFPLGFAGASAHSGLRLTGMTDMDSVIPARVCGTGFPAGRQPGKAVPQESRKRRRGILRGSLVVAGVSPAMMAGETPAPQRE